MGRLVSEAGSKLASLAEDNRPGSVIVAIMTDGLENASSEWTHPAIKALVEQQTGQWGWQFLYMGADQDAIEVGRNIGVAAANSITYGRGKSQDVMANVSGKISKYRTARAAGDLAAPMPAFTDDERRDLG
jgi:hypothetical protein